MDPQIADLTTEYRSYNDLPVEIVRHIYRYLNHGDLQAAADTCRQWREARNHDEFYENTVVRFKNVDQYFNNSGLSESQRPFQNLILKNVEMKEAFKMIAFKDKSIKHITLDSVYLDCKKLCKMLKLFRQLESLVIKKYLLPESLEDSDKMEDLLPSNFRPSIKHLTVICNDEMNMTYEYAFFSPLIFLISGLVSLNLSGWYPTNDDEWNDDEDETSLFLNFLERVVVHHRPTLRELNLSNTNLDRSRLAAIQKVGLKLTRLSLAKHNKLDTPSIIAFLATQPDLVQIDFSKNVWVNDELLANIIACNPLLEEVNVSQCENLTNVGARHFGDLQNLRCLNISKCKNITSEGLTESIAQGPNPKMRELRMNHLNGSCVRKVVVKMTELRVLDVSFCSGVTNETVQCIIENCRWLRELYLNGIGSIKDAAFTGNERTIKSQRHTIDELQRLRVLELSLLGYINDISLNYVFKLKELRRLNLSGCCQIKFENIVLDTSSLEYINLYYCKNITDQIIDLWTSKFPRLRVLRLDKCSQLTNRSLKAIKTNCKCLQTLSIEHTGIKTDEYTYRLR